MKPFKPTDDELAFLFPSEHWTSQGKKAPKTAQSLFDLDLPEKPEDKELAKADIDTPFWNKLLSAVLADPNVVRSVIGIHNSIGNRSQLTQSQVDLILNLKLKRLSGANFTARNCADSDFSYADLKRADFQGTNNEGAIFEYANNKEANFSNANNQRALFAYANNGSATFREANNQKANFWEADNCHAEFIDSNNQRADFSFANNAFADFRDANNEGADFGGAKS